MMVKRLASVLLATAFLGGIPFAANATAAQPCSSAPIVSVPVVHDYFERWTYVFEVVWCVEDGTITWTEPRVTPTVRDSTCAWRGTRDTTETPAENNGRTRFHMGEFTCQRESGTYGINPWGFITVYPDGSSKVADSGVD
jgi:hypothetical protein